MVPRERLENGKETKGHGLHIIQWKTIGILGSITLELSNLGSFYQEQTGTMAEEGFPNEDLIQDFAGQRTFIAWPRSQSFRAQGSKPKAENGAQSPEPRTKRPELIPKKHTS